MHRRAHSPAGTPPATASATTTTGGAVSSTAAPAAGPAAASPVAATAPGSNEQTAQAAAQTWLAGIDAGKYGQSWTDAAAPFKGAIDQPGWEKALTGVRTPLGRVQSRALKGAKYATSLPGAPDGEYVVVQYDTSFDAKRGAVETITMAKAADGQWRAAGYFIR